jgi:hypothetical protein
VSFITSSDLTIFEVMRKDEDMGDKNWYELFFENLDQNKEKLTPGDFRFYNIERLPIIAKKTNEFSSGCIDCKHNLTELEDLAQNLPEFINTTRQNRIDFEKKLTKITAHLKRKHKLQFATYYLSLYTILGFLAGLIAGSLVSYSVTGDLNINYLMISGVAGLILGRIAGNSKERKLRKESGLI